MWNFDQYRAADDRAEDELNEVEYYISDYFSYAEVPDDSYNTRFRNLVIESTRLSPAAKRYILETCLVPKARKEQRIFERRVRVNGENQNRRQRDRRGR